MQRDVSLRMAFTIAETALTTCGINTSVAVVDRADRLLVFLQGDGAAPHHLELAQRKAPRDRPDRHIGDEAAVPRDGYLPEHPRLLMRAVPISAKDFYVGLVTTPHK